MLTPGELQHKSADVGGRFYAAKLGETFVGLVRFIFTL